MELLVLNQEYEPVAIADVFESLIWTDRYSMCGDFELYTSIQNSFNAYTSQGSILCINESEHAMIVEDLKINTDAETGNHLVFTGRSLEFILYRRIIWNQTIIAGSVQQGILKLLNENIISPTNPDRQIINFIFEASDDPNILNLTMDGQYFGENLYDTVTAICDTFGIGFKVVLNSSNQLVFKLYSGVDRSYAQVVNPYIVFSPSYDNLLGSNYTNALSNLKNVALIAGEGEGSEKKTTSIGTVAGLARREMYVETSISSKTGEVTLSDAEYIAQLQNEGNKVLTENSEEESFEGEIDYASMYQYGRDYFLGDIVQIENEYNMNVKTRVSEIIHSQNESGISIYPTFSVIK